MHGVGAPPRLIPSRSRFVPGPVVDAFRARASVKDDGVSDDTRVRRLLTMAIPYGAPMTI